MNDLISRADAIAAHCAICPNKGKCPQDCPDREAFRMIKPVDAAPVVRCKDCKHWHDAPASDGYNSCEKDALIRNENFYCADAERR